MNLEREIAHDLLSIGAVFLRPDEPFTWASGIKSPIYCDNRLTLTAPAVRTAVEKGLVELIRTHYPDAEVLMGTSTAGIAHAAIVGHLMDLPMGYVRSGNKDHGRQNRIEGKLEMCIRDRFSASHPSSLTGSKRAWTGWPPRTSSTTPSPTSMPSARWPLRRGRSSRRTLSG